IELIGGSIDLASTKGRGTTFTVKIPLTLAIIPALIVAAGGQRFAIPQLAVAELVRAGSAGHSRIERLKGAEVLRLRNSLLPVVRLSDILKLDGARHTEERAGGAFVVVARVGAHCFGI